MKIVHVRAILDIEVEVEDDTDPTDYQERAIDCASFNGWRDFLTEVDVVDVDDNPE